jgi:hypothetical protein
LAGVCLDLHSYEIAVAQAEGLAELHIGRDLNHFQRMVAIALLVPVGAKDDGPAAEHSARDDAYANAPAVFFGFEAERVGRHAIRTLQPQVQSSGEQVQTGLSKIVVVQLGNPLSEIALTAEYSSFK